MRKGQLITHYFLCVEQKCFNLGIVGSSRNGNPESQQEVNIAHHSTALIQITLSTQHFQQRQIDLLESSM